MRVLAVTVGGIIGALLRFWVGLLLFKPESVFPYQTLLINLIGSFILGWFVIHGVKKVKNKNLVLALQTGVIGSFTTFSTFNAELLLLVKHELFSIALLYFIISAVAGIAAIYLGMKCGSATLQKAGAEQ